MKQFWQANKVFIMGLIGAIVLAVVNVQDDPAGISWSAFVMPAILAVSSYVGKSLRGQWSSIAGIAFTVIIGFVQAKLNHQPFHFDAAGFKLIVTQIAALYFGYTAPPAKSIAYEEHPTILRAKDN